VSNVIDRVQLKEFDRQIGAIIGLAKGILYCLVITFFAVTLWGTTRQMVLESHSGDWIAKGIRNANPVLPADIRKYLGEYIDQFEKELRASTKEEAPPQGGPAPGISPTPAPAAPTPGNSRGEAAKTPKRP
jgi:membrane protein required for colicin V production